MPPTPPRPVAPYHPATHPPTRTPTHPPVHPPARPPARPLPQKLIREKWKEEHAGKAYPGGHLLCIKMSNDYKFYTGAKWDIYAESMSEAMARLSGQRIAKRPRSDAPDEDHLEHSSNIWKKDVARAGHKKLKRDEKVVQVRRAS